MRFFLTILFTTIHLCAFAQFNVVLESSEVSGTAPLVVWLDASKTTHANPALSPRHDLLYQWNFGDPFSGVWDFKPLSKNIAFGPIATHVFDSTGIHIVELEIDDGQGYSYVKPFVIKIEPPEQVYQKTICFSTTGNFSDAPYNAELVTIQSLEDVQPYLQSNHRLLFQRGDTIKGQYGLTISHDINHLMIGAYGAALNLDKRNICQNAPVIILSSSQPVFHFLKCETDTISDVKIMDITLEGKRTAILIEQQLEKLLLYRLKFNSFSKIIENTVSNEELVIADCIIKGTSQKENLFTLQGTHLALLGNDIESSQSVHHLVDIQNTKQCILTHNRFIHPGIRANGLHINSQQTVDLAVINDNHFEGAEGVKTLTALSNIRHLIFDRNFLTAFDATHLRSGITANASHISMQNNIINASGAKGSYFTGIYIDQVDTLLSFLNISNNTIYKEDKIGLFVGIHTPRLMENITVANNLIYCPKAQDLKLVETQTPTNRFNEDGNIYPPSHPFIAQNPTKPLDFQLDTCNRYLTGAIRKTKTYKDYLAQFRTDSDFVNVGAFQCSGNPLVAWEDGYYVSEGYGYPFPARSYYTMDLSKISSQYDVEIFDAFGDLIHSDYKQRNTFYIWQTAPYENGTYWLKVSSKEATFLTKVKIEKK